MEPPWASATGSTAIRAGNAEKALEYIDANYDRDALSLNLVAEQTGMSANYLSAIFSQSMQKTFVEYVTEKRIEKAKSC